MYFIIIILNGGAYLISFSLCLSFVCRKTFPFYVSILHPVTLLNATMKTIQDMKIEFNKENFGRKARK